MPVLDTARALLGLGGPAVLPLPPALPSQAEVIERAVQAAVRANGTGDPSLPAASGLADTGYAGGQVDMTYNGLLPVVADQNKIAGGRLTMDNPWQVYGNMRLILPPEDYTQQWLTLNLDDPTIRTLPAPRLLQLLADLSPEVSRALWDFLRLCNPGYTCTAYQAGSVKLVNGHATGTPYLKAQKLVDEFHKRLDKRPLTSVNTIIGKLFFSAYLRGAMFSEVILDLDARTPLDIAVPDPATVRFMREMDPVYGQTWILGQFQIAQFVPLVRPTIQYLPIDPAPGIPYGRSPAAPAIFASLFLLGLLHDVRRVISQQGYPRLDISIDLEKLRQSMPAQITADPKRWLQWVQSTVDSVKSAFTVLKPDQAFVHSHVVTVNRPVGTLDASSLGAVPGLIDALERMLARALKTMPILMGNAQSGGGEANSNRQYEIEVAGIKAVQDLGQRALASMDEIALEAQGVASEVVWEFGEIRDAAAFRQAQTHAVELANTNLEYDRGYIGQKEAANKAVGHDPDEPEPRFISTMEQLDPDAGTGANTPAPGGEDPVPERPRPQAGAPDNKETGASKDPSASRSNGHSREPIVTR